MSDIVGYIAAMFSVMAFMPQAWKVIKTRDTKDLSTPMWILEILAFAMWIVYGVTRSALPIVIPNAICFVLALFILVMKLLPEHRKHAVADKLDPSVSTGS